MPSLRDTLLIFSDLDGSLLDIHTYEWQPAMPWLDRLMDNQVPVILCSSKTAAEMLDLQLDLGLEGLPFIAENGAVIQPDVRWDKIQRQIRG
ncbi:mannosyl-3-phosphoglycerate phosphatase [Enterobacter asburiae]|nr:mannosyl-3-phosphoglycerate phosphatase [Enterobacter asburiae]